ncbi:Crp/Fnr family transcriptional regulator [Janibacter cremeus]|uniref:Crp/Fnr family transcriptional regulator n=1 Tax=Janibacter cremeus TaxID=1285192 RepID=UPI0023F895A0|nr:Crp/Fnr family transcriptional regulator [Janibacter cremeus]WEV77846.1 Crp/Fnr family transcriptional regulator [Janibacter cremeus]
MTRTQPPVVHAQSEDLCVARVPIFQGLGHEQQRGVAQLARPRRLAKGEQVYAAEEASSLLLVLHTGSMKISRVSVDGFEHVIRVLRPGDFVGESAFLTGRTPDHFATALEPTSMCTFRHEDLEQLVRTHPSIVLRMLADVSRRLGDAETRLTALISGDVSSRLADYLLSLPGSPTEGGTAVRLPLAKKDIASLLDTTPESLSRQLRRLRESGVVVGHGTRELVIHDVDALLELVAQV